MKINYASAILLLSLRFRTENFCCCRFAFATEKNASEIAFNGCIRSSFQNSVKGYRWVGTSLSN